MDRPRDLSTESSRGDSAHRPAPVLADRAPEQQWAEDDARPVRDRVQALEAHIRCLGEAGRLLASSSDVSGALQRVARLIVPMLGDWCIVDLVDDAHARPPTVIFANPADANIARQLQRTTLASAEDEADSGTARRPADMVPDRAAILHELGVHAKLSVPLLARGRTLGTLTLLTTTSGRELGPDALLLAEDLAQRAAVTVDNARLRRQVGRATAARSQFVATMSHEFRTPLQAILGFAELLLMGVPEDIPEGARMHAERIVGASRHLLELINQVLEFARLDAGRDVVHREAMDVAVFARDAVALVEPLARAKGLRLLMDAPPTGTMLVTDAGKLRQICYNLLANAVKFTTGGEVTLAVMMGEDGFLLEVRDTGVGILPADLARIFESFYQVERAATGMRSGTGLGLSISQHLARLLGGRLEATSVPDHGSTFRLMLPPDPSLAPVAAAEDRTAPSSVDSPPTSPSRDASGE